MAYFGDMNISIIKLNKIQHKILGIISERVIKYGNTFEGLPAVDFATIIKNIKCKREDLDLYTARLFSDDECSYYNVSGVEGLFCKPKGITSYVNQKYLRENNSIITTKIKDVSTIAISFIAIASAIYTAIKAITFEEKNKVDIKKLQTQVDTLILLNKFEHPTRTPLDSSVSSKH